LAAAGTDPRAANCLGAEDHTLPREVSMYSQLKLRPLGAGFFAWPDGRCGTALRVRAGAIQSRGKDSARILAFDAAITPS